MADLLDYMPEEMIGKSFYTFIMDNEEKTEEFTSNKSDNERI
jgi:hypothetical protein